MSLFIHLYGYKSCTLGRLAGLDTESFINGLRRFVARRGNPKVIFCDNGTNFVGTRNIFIQLIRTRCQNFVPPRI